MRAKMVFGFVLILAGGGLVGCPSLGVYFQPEDSRMWASERNQWFPYKGSDENSPIRIAAVQFHNREVNVSLQLKAICDSASYLLSEMTLMNSHQQTYKLIGALLSSGSSTKFVAIDPDSAIPLHHDSSRLLMTAWTRETKQQNVSTGNDKGYDTILVEIGSIRCAKEDSVVALGLVKLLPGEAMKYR